MLVPPRRNPCLVVDLYSIKPSIGLKMKWGTSMVYIQKQHRKPERSDLEPAILAGIFYPTMWDTLHKPSPTGQQVPEMRAVFHSPNGGDWFHHIPW